MGDIESRRNWRFCSHIVKSIKEWAVAARRPIAQAPSPAQRQLLHNRNPSLFHFDVAAGLQVFQDAADHLAATTGTAGNFLVGNALFNAQRAILLRLTTTSARNLAFIDVYGRLTSVLLALAKPQEDGTLRLEERITHHEIASRAGCSREMVSRILKDLRPAATSKWKSDGLPL